MHLKQDHQITHHVINKSFVTSWSVILVRHGFCTLHSLDLILLESHELVVPHIQVTGSQIDD
jgi:hypothetical protein